MCVCALFGNKERNRRETRETRFSADDIAYVCMVIYFRRVCLLNRGFIFCWLFGALPKIRQARAFVFIIYHLHLKCENGGTLSDHLSHRRRISPSGPHLSNKCCQIAVSGCPVLYLPSSFARNAEYRGVLCLNEEDERRTHARARASFVMHCCREHSATHPEACVAHALFTRVCYFCVGDVCCETAASRHDATRTQTESTH